MEGGREGVREGGREGGREGCEQTKPYFCWSCTYQVSHLPCLRVLWRETCGA